MYARTKTFKNKDGSTRTYVQIVESRRDGGKIRQKVLANLGRIENLQEGAIDKLIESLSRYSLQCWVRFSTQMLATPKTREWGPALIFGHLWQQLGLEKILEKAKAKTQADFNFSLAAFTMALNRLSDPRSKRGVKKWAGTIHLPGIQELQLQHYYRALDYLAEHKNDIEQRLFDSVRNLFNIQLDLVFWDTTTTYFEGNGPDMASMGYSKDHRPDRNQLVIGVLMTRDGFPIAHQVFPGNMADINTFRQCIKDVQQRFNVGRVILVADRGMVSNQLLEEITAAGLSYIVGVKMRVLRALDSVLSRGGRYQQVADNLKVKQVHHEGERYVICLNPEQERKDKHTREEIVTKLQKKLNQETGQLIGNRGYRRYLKITRASVTLDDGRIAQESRYDGKYVLRTNTSLTPAEVALSYKSLWQIERAFRELKSGLDLRPVYHWTDKRVRGHIMVCFLALVLESALCRKLKESGSDCSYADVMDDLKELRAVDVEIEGQRFLTRTDMTGQSYETFKALKLRPPLLVQQI